MRPEQVIDMTHGQRAGPIQPQDWERARFRWLNALTADPDLSDRAFRVGVILAFTFANAGTARCDPSNAQVAEVLGRSADTVKRAVAELVAGGWITRKPGRHTGAPSKYAFVLRASVVPFPSAKRGANLHREGGKSAPKEGGKSAPFDTERGANLHREGGRSAPAYNIAKPYKNHRGARLLPQRSENPAVIADATRLIERVRAGRSEVLSDAPIWVLAHILAAGMLTDDELRGAGISQAENEDRADD
ncbi:helix-turn-helix domain-containing protein [Marinovum sp. E06]|uniref:helix-turn-helix domain-containing protein n=1 Tax=unclassified Marinovum TaxID=2647166 RepID=UPI003EDBF32B